MTAPVDVYEPEADTGLPMPASAASAPPPAPSVAEAADDTDPRAMKALAGVAIGGGSLEAAIGFTGSYNTLRHLALEKGFGLFSYAFPIGIDVGILVLLAMDLFMVRKRAPLPLLRWFAHGLTVATVVFNAAASGNDPLAASMHGVIPVLFIAAVEAARHYVGRLATKTQFGAPPLVRWLLAPVPTFRIWRRMRMWDKPDYHAVVERQRQITIHGQMLRKQHGFWWRFKAPADARLPIKMARFGLSVDEALEIPVREAEAESRRAEEAELRKREADHQRELRESEAELRHIERQAEIDVAKSDAAAKKAAAEARLKAAKAEAENAAANVLRMSEEQLRVEQAEADAEVQRINAQAERDAAQARRDEEKAQLEWDEELRRRKAQAEREDAETEAAREAAQAKARRVAEEEEKTRAEAELAAAEARRRSAEAELRIAEAEAEQAKAEAERAAAERAEAEDLLRAAEARRLAAEAERDAAEAADEARMSVPDRDARRVARMIVAAGGGEESVSLKEIVDELGVSQTTASDRRARAIDYLRKKEEAARKAAQEAA